MEFIFTSCDDCILRAWRVEGGRLLASLTLDEELTDVACSGDRVWAGTQSGRVCRFVLHHTFPIGGNAGVYLHGLCCVDGVRRV